MSITKNALVTAAVLGLTACVVKEGPPEGIERAIPKAEQVSIKLPVGTNRTVGELSEWYVATRNITTTFNGGSAWVLILIHTIVQFPVTSVDGSTYTWGPFSDALDPAEYRLDVVDNGDETYNWSLSGRSKTQANSQFEMIITGLADGSAGENQGNGNFLIDFDAGRRVNPIDADPEARGQVSVSYDLAARHLDLHIMSTDDNGNPVTADYAYNEGADGSGDMVFGIEGEMGGGPGLEQAVIRSRWLASGDGRADVAIHSDDTGAGAAGSQCWDGQFRTEFEGVIAGDPTTGAVFFAAAGDEASCAYTEADLPE
jgi:hypothetical protein